MNNSNSILVITDFSYWMYFTLFGAAAQFQRKYPQEASIWIKDPKDVDQKNLPNLLNCDTYKRLLKQYVMKRLETIEGLTKANYQDEIDSADKIDIVFAVDDKLTNNFRKNLYAGYKAQRVITPKSYNIQAIKDYIVNVIFKELEVEETYNYHLISVEGAEADDVIACICKNLAKDYKRTILYASDHDFIQLKNIDQYDLHGKKVECKIGDIEVTPDEYLLGKILLGDSADNIQKVFPRVGPKKVIKLIKDKSQLKQKLLENQDSTKQFLLNKKLISFKFIPKDLEKHIVEFVSKKLYKNEVLNSHVDFKEFMTL